MSDHLAPAAAALGLPEPIVLRSAEARAKASGTSTDDVLAAWAGGAPAPAAPAPDPSPAAEPAAAAEPDTAPAPAASTPAAPATAPAAAAAPRVVEAAPVPATVDVSEALDWDQVTTVATIGLKERTRVHVPMWLLSVFVLVPVISLFYIGLNAEGATCGESGQLAVDFEGNLTNCDGSAFEPGGGPGGAELAAIFTQGRDTYASCVACHGAGGGGASGPALSGGAVVSTFPQCAEHVAWVTLGSDGWRAERGNTYGAQDRTVQGGMPGFASLAPEVVAAVSLYERVAFGGQALDEAGVDCGFVEPEGDVEESPGGEGEGTTEPPASGGG